MSFVPAIDFRELRRQERTKAAVAAASHSDGNSSGRRTTTDDATASSSASLSSASPLSRLLPLLSTEPQCSSSESDRSIVAPLSQLPPWTFAASTTVMTSLSKLAPVCDNPPLLRYQDTFLPINYQIALEEWLLDLPHLDYFDAQQQHSENRGWVSLPHAKRQVAVFALDDESTFRQNSVVSSSSTIAALEPLLSMVTPLFPLSHPPNHILVNRYSNVDEVGILPHTDGPAYYPLTCTISLGASVLLTFTQSSSSSSSPPSTANSGATGAGGATTPASPPPPLATIRLRLSGCGSLVVFSESLYSDYLHSIDPTDQMHTDAGSDCESNFDDGFDARAEADPQCFNPSSYSRRDRISITIRYKYQCQ